MRGQEMLDAVGYVGEDLILKAETAHKEKKRIPLRRALVFAAAALLLLGAAAATAGVIRNRMNVRLDPDGVNEIGFNAENGYLVLSEEARQGLLAAREPDLPMCHMYFDTIAEWQAFFGLSYVGQPGLDLTEKVNTEGMNPDAVIEVLVPVVDTEDGPRFGLMVTFIPNGPESAVPLSAQCAAEGGVGIQAANHTETEQTVEEYTSPSGIPYVIVRTSSEGSDRCGYELYYGYGPAVYCGIGRHAIVLSQTETFVEELKAFADSLVVYMPE